MNERKNKVASFFQQLKNSNRHLLIVGLGVTGKAWVDRLKLENVTHSVISSLTATTNTANHLDKVTDIILSPGIPRSFPFVQAAIKKSITVWGEIDFLYPLFKHFTTIAITGTDGKTSTLTLTHHLISHGLPLSTVLAGGNNGTPIISLIDEFEVESGALILEFSSYMLEELHQFRANYSVVLNIAPDHLDRYQDFEHYIATKYQLLKHITSEDYFMVNLDHEITAEYLNQHFPKLTAKKIFIGKSSKKSADYNYDKDFFYLKNKKKIPQPKTSSFRWAIPSTYPINMLTAIAFADLLNVPSNKINKLLSSFQTLEHRLEPLILSIGQQPNLIVINDSKSTTLQATIKAVETFHSLDSSEYSINLILGGQNKGISFIPLKAHLAKLNKIYFYGQAGKEIKSMLFDNQEVENTYYHYSLKSVIDVALKDLTQNNLSKTTHTLNSKKLLLFSPACASFDQFNNYSERGKFFKQQVISFFGCEEPSNL